MLLVVSLLILTHGLRDKDVRDLKRLHRICLLVAHLNVGGHIGWWVDYSSIGRGKDHLPLRYCARWRFDILLKFSHDLSERLVEELDEFILKLNNVFIV
jgi:hypothetical protein